MTYILHVIEVDRDRRLGAGVLHGLGGKSFVASANEAETLTFDLE